MKTIKRLAVCLAMSILLATASFAEFNAGGELTAGLASSKLFGTEESQYLTPLARSVTAIRFSLFIGYNAAIESSGITLGVEQHFGIHPVSMITLDHVPLVFSLPTRGYIRFGSDKVAFDILAGVDNQIVVASAGQYPAYIAENHDGINQYYAAANGGYAIALEIGVRLVLRHFYLTSLVDVPISSNYIFPGLLRVGLGLTF